MSDSPVAQEVPEQSETIDAAEAQRKQLRDRYLPYLGPRIAIMTCVIFIGWIYNVFFSTFWIRGEEKAVGDILAAIPYIPLAFVSLLIVRPLEWMQASTLVIQASLIIYGIIISPIIAKLFYRRWHGDREEFASSSEAHPHPHPPVDSDTASEEATHDPAADQTPNN